MTGQVVKSVLHPGDTYLLQAQLGEGACGSVYAAVRSNAAGVVANDEFAIKLIPLVPNDAHLERTCREVANLNTLFGHPHVIDMQDVVKAATFVPGDVQLGPVPAIGIVMPRARSNLERYISNARRKGATLPEDTARWFFQQLVLAVHYCHLNGKGQRDIKPSNFLLFPDQRNRILGKLADFGWSVDIINANTPNAGTPLYQAPEIPLGDTRQPYDCTKADAWSCGVVLFHMLFPHTFDKVRKRLSAQVAAGGALLHWVNWLEELNQALQHRSFSEDGAMSGDCYSLLHGLLQVKHQQRTTLDQVLQHPWFVAGLPAGLDPVAFNLRALAVPPLFTEHRLAGWLRATVLTANPLPHPHELRPHHQQQQQQLPFASSDTAAFPAALPSLNLATAGSHLGGIGAAMPSLTVPQSQAFRAAAHNLGTLTTALPASTSTQNFDSAAAYPQPRLLATLPPTLKRSAAVEQLLTADGPSPKGSNEPDASDSLPRPRLRAVLR